MLARANRVTRAGDFRSAVRQGRRVGTPHTVIHCVANGGREMRFGFIVTKSVGGAVTRNLVKRRLRAVCSDLLAGEREPSGDDAGSDVVVRAMPGCDGVDWRTLHGEIIAGIGKAMRKR